VGAAVIELLERHGVALEGRRVAVLGRSNWVRPTAGHWVAVLAVDERMPALLTSTATQ
jgi:5,10-methylene-tetrahydrofolate dehydrogenase/methenyl tetrahydrofolate cyclohydrolase